MSHSIHEIPSAKKAGRYFCAENRIVDKAVDGRFTWSYSILGIKNSAYLGSVNLANPALHGHFSLLTGFFSVKINDCQDICI